VNRAARGRAAEDAAVALLERNGYRIVARNVRLPGGEIDVIARDGSIVVFVEVKARAGGAFAARSRPSMRVSARRCGRWLPTGCRSPHRRRGPASTS